MDSWCMYTKNCHTYSVATFVESQLKMMGIVYGYVLGMGMGMYGYDGYVLSKIAKQKHVKQLKDMNVVLSVKMNVKNM